MDSYTITIAPNDDSGAATRLVVDTSGEQVRITDVHLHAPDGLSSGHIPTVDFALLLQAVTGSASASGQTVAGATALSAPQDNTPALEAAPPAEPQAAPPAPRRRAKKTAPPVVAAPATRRSRPRAEPATPAKSTAKTRKSAAAPAKKQTATARKAQTPVKRATTESGRVYRRTPDDLAEVFEQVETVAGVAEHYGVPRYTAQGWVNRLRATS